MDSIEPHSPSEQDISRHDNLPFTILDPSETRVRDELEEAYQWHSLFQQGYLTAHELSGLKREDTPEVEGALFRTETENLRKTKEFIDENLSDSAFREKLQEIRPLLPRPFGEMIGAQQRPSHHGIDPVDHTFNALTQLSTEDLSAEDARIARTTLVFHDVGKVYDAQDPEHPQFSAQISQDYLIKMGYTTDQIKRILNQIQWHDALGDSSRKDGRNVFNPNDVLLFFPTERELNLHRRIALADISSIPGLARYLPNVESTYNALVAELRDSTNRVALDLTSQLPFQEIGYQQFTDLAARLAVIEDFNTTDIRESIMRRRSTYEALPESEREYLEKLIVQSSLRNREELLDGLKFVGHETDTEYVAHLERKYGVDLYNLRVAVGMFRLTYDMWNLNQKTAGANLSREDIRIIEHTVGDLVQQSLDLSRYSVHATHATNPDVIHEIDRARALVKSEVAHSRHYEGEGVYVGLLGSYRNWSRGKRYEMSVSLGDTLPIIVSYNNPKAMANILCEMLDIEPELNDSAIPHGLTQWYQDEYDHDPVDEWKLDILKKFLGEETILVNDESGLPCVIMDTKEKPIVWQASAAHCESEDLFRCQCSAIYRGEPVRLLKKIRR